MNLPWLCIVHWPLPHSKAYYAVVIPRAWLKGAMGSEQGNGGLLELLVMMWKFRIINLELILVTCAMNADSDKLISQLTI